MKPSWTVNIVLLIIVLIGGFYAWNSSRQDPVDDSRIEISSLKLSDFSEINMFLNGFARVIAFSREIVPGGPMTKDLIYDGNWYDGAIFEKRSSCNVFNLCNSH